MAGVSRKPFQRLTAVLITILLGFEVCGCETISTRSEILPPRTSSRDQSEVRESEEGKKIHDAIVASQYLYTEPGLKKYVSDIGLALARFSARPYIAYTFTILVDERIYSTSAPGGYVYITTGLLNFFESEAELAAVLAHEIAEIQLLRPNFTAYRKATEDLASVSAMVGPFFGPIGALSAAGFILLSAIPAQEPQPTRLLEADQTAMHLMIKAGYDPQALIDMLKKIKNEQINASPLVFDWQDRRTITPERVATAESTFAKLNLNSLELVTGFEKYQSMMRGLRDMHGKF